MLWHVAAEQCVRAMTHDLSSIGVTLAKRLGRYLKDNGESEFNLNRKNVADALKTGAPACAANSGKLRRATMLAKLRVFRAVFAASLLPDRDRVFSQRTAIVASLRAAQSLEYRRFFRVYFAFCAAAECRCPALTDTFCYHLARSFHCNACHVCVLTTRFSSYVCQLSHRCQRTARPARQAR